MHRRIAPSPFFLRLLRWYCKPALLARIEGDLIESYYTQVKKSGKQKADIHFAFEVILLFRPGIITPPGIDINSYIYMTRNYFNVAWRNLLRSKTFSLMNIGGLALGVMCSLLISLWINDELNVDAFNSNKDVYSVYERVFPEGRIDAGAWTPGELAAELKQQFPEIKYASGLWTHEGESLFTLNDKRLNFKGIAADSDFFKIFNYALIEGSATTALLHPDDIAISRKMAEAFFGSLEAAYGNTIRMDNRKDFRIAAVFENLPSSASKQFEFVSNWPDLLSSVQWLKIWIYRGPFTFIQLRPGADAAGFEIKIKDFLTQFVSLNSGNGYRAELGLQPYNEMYLYSNFQEGVPAGGRIEYVRLFALIAVFILLIACINFMNLSTARSIKRAKEVGVRKTMGAFRSYLVTQFIGEAMLLTFFAMILALVLVTLILPYFNVVTNKTIALPLASPSFWGIVVALLFVTGLTAGAYPAFVISALNPVRILKGSLKADPGVLVFRKALVIFQFVLVIAFISGMITISRQVDFMQSKNLGFDRENLLYVPFQGDLINKYEVFKQQLSERPGIQNVSRSTNAPSHINTHEYDLAWEGKSQDEKAVAIHNGIGYEFLPMMKIQILQGRNFSKDFISDTTGFIINETALKLTGYDDPIGKPLHFLQRDGTIIGVVKDFHLNSLRDPIKPLVMYLGENATWGYILVKTQPGETQEAIESVESVFKQIEPEFPARYYFADEEFQKLYSSERTVRALTSSFTIFAISISCLGLLGLMMFTIEQRRKEIGVRKVIGASTLNIIGMLSADTVKLVIVASALATPLAWFAMDKWLAQFAYQIDLSWWLLLMPTLMTLLIALATTGVQAAKAALTNPVKSLKSE